MNAAGAGWQAGSCATDRAGDEARDTAWRARFGALLRRALGAEAGESLQAQYCPAFGADYRAALPPRLAAKDVLQLRRFADGTGRGMALWPPCPGSMHFRLQFYSAERRCLDEYLPLLANLDLRLVDQTHFRLATVAGSYAVRSFEINAAPGQAAALRRLRGKLLDLLQALQDGAAENDALNALLLQTGMDWKAIAVLRAYRDYYLQLGLQSARASFHRALANNPQVAACLFDYFEARFRPDAAFSDAAQREEQALAPLRLKLLQGLETVKELNDDRILRSLFNLIDATLRSNYHVRRNADEFFVAIKVSSLGVIEMPAPKPEFEIFVHNAAMQGIHLRAGKIARGGIRWSDRPDDFRGEILDLMQTQVNKNALIVPTGSKGGFVVKRQAPGETWKQAGERAYRQLIRGLLDLTDNYCDGQIEALPGIVAYDDGDPYLVVAADKGTAQFSDLANAIAAEYRFWLRDAFASGGSNGYNHKALGITARGAWECVKRHFRELDKDIQSEPFSVVGIGSMDGDVFGNGMLLSPCIRLRAAFSGQHIFIDPDPNPKTSSAERRRLYELPGSSWDDYARQLISKGGGVFRRDAKDILVSAEVKQWLGIRYRSLDGESLIRYLLAAPVDLLWLGGIGTYVKASDERHEEVGDRANDNVRVDAAQVKASVVGEGANLGFTQRARVEYALLGGRINADAVDNSAGVDTSDHEVNLKILLVALHKAGLVENPAALFASLSDAVCQSVLADNYAQALCLSLEQLRSAAHPELYLQLAERLQTAGLLASDAFPAAKALRARPGAQLTRPELAALLAASKRLLRQQLAEQREFLASDCCAPYLQAYFPPPIAERFAEQLPAHPLAEAITATSLANRIINQAGCLFLAEAWDNGASDLAGALGTYLAFEQLLDAPALRTEIQALDDQVASAVQYGLLLQLENVLAELCRQQLAYGPTLHPEPQLLADYRGQQQIYLDAMPPTVQRQDDAAHRQRLLQYFQDGISSALVERLMAAERLEDFPLLRQAAETAGAGLDKVVAAYIETNEFLGLLALHRHLLQLPTAGRWEQQAVAALRATLKQAAASLALSRLQQGGQSCAAYFHGAPRAKAYARYVRLQQEANAAGAAAGLLPWLLLGRELEGLARCG